MTTLLTRTAVVVGLASLVAVSVAAVRGWAEIDASGRQGRSRVGCRKRDDVAELAGGRRPLLRDVHPEHGLAIDTARHAL